MTMTMRSESISMWIAFWFASIIFSTQNVSSFTTIPYHPSKQCPHTQITSSSSSTCSLAASTNNNSWSWRRFFPNKDEDNNNIDNIESSSREFSGGTAKEAETMQRTAKMMEDHRRSQEAAERTAAIMEELSSVQVVGKSKAGAKSGGIGIGGGDRKGGVKVAFDGRQRPIGVKVDPNFLFASSSSSEPQGVISVEDLNDAITDAMLDGYEQSGNLMEEKIKDLYGQLGLQREPLSLRDGQNGDKKNKK